MAVEVLLVNQVEGLGIEGDVVKVADGYARNYLLPQGYATEVTEGRRRQVEKKRAARLVELEAAKVAAEEISKKLADLECRIEVKVGKNGKMFGSVGVPQLVEKLAAEGFEIERSKFKLHQPLNEVGVFDVSIKLHPEVEATLKVWIVEEK